MEIFAVSPDLSQSVDGIYANDRCLVIKGETSIKSVSKLVFFFFTWMNIQDFISIKALVFPFLVAALTELLNFLSAEHVYKCSPNFRRFLLALFDSVV